MNFDSIAPEELEELPKLVHPMLSPQDDPLKRKTYFKDLPFPLLCSPKFDGIRGLPQPTDFGSKVLSRTCKPLRSTQLQKLFGIPEMHYLDAEYTEGDPCTPDCYIRSDSHIMSFNKPGNLTAYVFDDASPELHMKSFWFRLEAAKERVAKINRPDVVFVEHELCRDVDELLAFEAKVLAQGFEGVMMRTQRGMYKDWARATWNDGIIFKLKRFAEDEGLLVGVEENQVNNNEQVIDERGYAKRSKAMAGLSAGGRVGTFLVEFQGTIIRVATGTFKHPMLIEIWNNQEAYVGKKIIKFRHFLVGVKDLPRYARAVGFRDRMDM
jgi:DNA ligase-1